MMIVTYLVYIAVSLAITVWVGRSLHHNGRVFLVENFQGQERLADSINHLLLVGFYLVNIGVVVLGLMHFFNMRMLVRFRTSKLFKVFGSTEAAGPRPIAYT